MRCFVWSWFLRIGHSDAGELSAVVKELSKVFDPLAPASHVTDVQAGIYFEHLYGVDDKNKRFTSDFYLTYQWLDTRWKSANWSKLIHDGLAETEAITCDSGSHRRLSDTNVSFTLTHFLEFGHDEMDLVWRPDLYLRNLYKDEQRLQSEMMRIYEDGTFELSQFVWAILSLDHVRYNTYPFDSQKLSIMVESLSHTTKRIDLHPLHEFTGLEESLTKNWPGWSFNSFREDAYLVSPDYVHANPCRSEQKARVKFTIDVSREFKPTSLIVVTLLVVTSWAGFFIRVQALMPRVATGLISYLTINSIAQSRMSEIPQVNYDVWMSVFLDICRYGVFLSVLETVVAQYIAETISIRIALSLDRWARVVLPLDFMVITLILIFSQTDDSVRIAAILSVVNIACVIIVTAIYIIAMYSWLRKQLHANPLKVYGDGNPPLDVNECRHIFKGMNKHFDGNTVIDALQIIEWFLHRPPFKNQDHFQDNAMTIKKRLSLKIGPAPLTVEQFLQNQKAIFIELRNWRESEMVLLKSPAKVDKNKSPSDVGMNPNDYQTDIETEPLQKEMQADVEEDHSSDEDGDKELAEEWLASGLPPPQPRIV